MPCKLCKQRGKTWKGDEPKCAFENGVFSSDNWNCATMGALRNLAEGPSVYNNDQHCATLPVFDCGEFLIISWYKSRGQTEGAWIVDSCSILPLSIGEAEAIIDKKSERPTREQE